MRSAASVIVGLIALAIAFAAGRAIGLEMTTWLFVEAGYEKGSAAIYGAIVGTVSIGVVFLAIRWVARRIVGAKR